MKRQKHSLPLCWISARRSICLRKQLKKKENESWQNASATVLHPQAAAVVLMENSGGMTVQVNCILGCWQLMYVDDSLQMDRCTKSTRSMSAMNETRWRKPSLAYAKNPLECIRGWEEKTEHVLIWCGRERKTNNVKCKISQPVGHVRLVDSRLIGDYVQAGMWILCQFIKHIQEHFPPSKVVCIHGNQIYFVKL